MEDDAKVEIASPNDILTTGDTISITWSPLSLLQVELITVDPASLTVDVGMYEVQMTESGSYVQSEIAVLASDIPNSGTATIKIPSIEFSSNTTAVYSVNIIVSLNNKGPLRRKRFIGNI